MINSIIMKNVATYTEKGVTIDELQKINFIYGENGCGKTLISNFILQPQDPLFKDCVLTWYNNLPMTAIVYNKQFREKHFGDGKIPGVFTLGYATKEQIKAIEDKQKQLSNIKDLGIQKKNTLENQQKEHEKLIDTFQEQIWKNIYKKYEYEFNEAFERFKAKNRFRIELISEFDSNQSELKNYDNLKDRAKTIFGNRPTVMDEISFTEYSRLVEITQQKIWSKKIIGKEDVEIAKLINKLNINDWINEGRKYIEHDSDVCPFCQKHTIDSTFKEQLENYFDESFIADTKIIKELKEEYNRIAENIINLLQGIENKEKINITTKLNLELFSSLQKTLGSQFISNREILNNKIKEPSRSVELVSVKEQLDAIQELITKTNSEIRKHNEIVKNYDKERALLINEIWKFIIEENKIIISDFIKNNNGMQKGIENLDKQLHDLREKYSALDKEIKEDNKNITSVQSAVDNINDILKAYGFLNFKIVPVPQEPNYYKILREDGSSAQSTLSEGEITFITFLYYWQLAKGALDDKHVSEERILVIDDPISSLDSTVLFVVSSLIKEIIKEIKDNVGSIKQLLLLTHNIYFHKEVSFIDGKEKENNNTFYWILRKNDNVTTIQAYEKENPIKNSYELLWQELKNPNNTSLITIQNIMRRIIETCFKILGKYNDEKIINCFNKKQEKEICRSLICWINEGSHCIPDDIFVAQQDSVKNKYTEVFKKIFQETNHIEHYNMMMGILNEK